MNSKSCFISSSLAVMAAQDMAPVKKQANFLRISNALAVPAITGRCVNTTLPVVTRRAGSPISVIMVVSAKVPLSRTATNVSAHRLSKENSATFLSLRYARLFFLFSSAV